MAATFSAELSLAVACCRWPPASSTEQIIRDAARRVRDWDLFDAIVQRNRITPLAHSALARAGVQPAPVAVRLAHRANSAARKALAMAAESLRLNAALERAGLPAMVIKGSALALLAYGQLGLKEAKDIDLLTGREVAPQALRLLSDMGYRGQVLRLSDQQLASYLRKTTQAELMHPDSGIAVELHWGLFDHGHILAGMGVHSPSQELTLGGRTLRTLADPELFAYLCVHGSVHNWARLKWLADLGAFLAVRPVDERERLYIGACERGADRAASVALMLCTRLLGLELPETLRRVMSGDRIAHALQASALRGLAYRGGAVEHERYTAAWLQAAVCQFFLVPGPAHALAHGRFLWDRPVDRLARPLPAGLDFLYPLLRVPLWLGRVGSRMLRLRRQE